MPLTQAYTSSAVLHVRASSPGAAASLAAPVRAIVRQLMSTLPVPPLRPITEALDVYLLPQRVAAWVGATMAVFGLILAAVGVYGVTAFAISRRRREIAIRLALGATSRDVTLLVLRRGARAPLVGIATGLAAGVGLSAILAGAGVVRGVRLADPVSVLGTVGLLTAIALVAMADPVRRILRRPAMVALREE